MSNYKTYIIAGLLLTTMFVLAFTSILEDTLTFDELAHIGSGYSYLTLQDYRLNPEHPPLAKDLAAIPLLFANLNFPIDHPAWIQEGDPVWWLQFDIGTEFIYNSGNDPDQIMLWSRIPMILLLIFLGLFIFSWTRKLYGNKTALLALFLFSFSPTLIAHGRFVTTDVAAAIGAVIATYFWLNFLKEPIKKNIFMAGVFLGIALLFKFSLILLIPFLGIITLIHAWLHKRSILKYIGISILIGLISLIFIIWPVYQIHTLNYPVEQQIKDTDFLLNSTSASKQLIQIPIWMSSKPILRPIAHYLTGLTLAANRSATGHTTYFLGEVSTKGKKAYFPIVYAIKEPLAFHVLLIISLLYLAWLIKKPPWQQTRERLKNWIKNHFVEFSMLVFLFIYWATSLTSALNIGVRHLLPVFPFTIILLSAAVMHWIKPPFLKVKYILLAVLLLWQAVSVIKTYPHFLAYFNELAGGPDNGYIYVVDSNLDWGQDLKRLKIWINENKIDNIYIDYFGGGNLDYHIKENYTRWWGTRNPEEIPLGSYLAVSVSQLQGGKGISDPEFDGESGFYLWLNKYEPVANIGHSIFIYYID